MVREYNRQYRRKNHVEETKQIRRGFKINEVKLSYASSKTVKEIAFDLGIAENLMYNWRKKYNKDGDKTPYTTIEEEVKKLRLENAELKMERDMLKKAAAYFAKLQK